MRVELECRPCGVSIVLDDSRDDFPEVSLSDEVRKWDEFHENCINKEADDEQPERSEK